MPYRFRQEAQGGPTAQQQTDITRDFALANGWSNGMPDPLNPAQTLSRGKFMDRVIDAYVERTVATYREEQGRLSAAATSHADMTNLREP